MAAVHLGRLPGDGFDLDAHLLTFLGAVDGFVIQLDAGDHANVHKLEETSARRRQRGSGQKQQPVTKGGGAYPFTGDAERRPLPQHAGVDAHAHHDGVSGVEDELRQNPQLHGEHRHVPGDVRAVRGRSFELVGEWPSAVWGWGSETVVGGA